jgi:hypothetical protein
VPSHPASKPITAPVVTVNHIREALLAKAKKPRMVVGYQNIFKEVFEAIDAMLAAGYDMDDAIAEFQNAEVANFDAAEFTQQYERYRAARKRPAKPTPPEPPAAPPESVTPPTTGKAATGKATTGTTGNGSEQFPVQNARSREAMAKV